MQAVRAVDSGRRGHAGAELAFLMLRLIHKLGNSRREGERERKNIIRCVGFVLPLFFIKVIVTPEASLDGNEQNCFYTWSV